MSLKIFRHLMWKFYLRTDQEILTFFMINSNLSSNRQGLHYGKRNEKGRKKMYYYYFFSNFLLRWVSCFYFCNNSFFITDNAPLIIKVFNNKTHAILFLIRKLHFLSHVLLFTILLLIFWNWICHLKFSLSDLFLSLLRDHE